MRVPLLTHVGTTDPELLDEQLTALASQVQTLSEDAERLDWLDERGFSIAPMFDPAAKWAVRDETLAEVATPPTFFGQTIREAINTARAALA